HSYLHSFPTRRSSDLIIIRPLGVFVHTRMINSPRKTKKHLFALCPLFQRHKRELPPTVQGFLNWPAARWQLGKIRFTTQLFHSRSEEHTSELQSRFDL